MTDDRARLADAAIRCPAGGAGWGGAARAGRASREPPAGQAGPEHEALLADSVGAALMVVLDTLTPAERVQGAAAASDAARSRKREMVAAFLAAARGRDFGALLALLDPDAVLAADPAAVWAPGGWPKVVFAFTISDGKITGIALDGDPDRLRDLDIVFLSASGKER